MGSYIARVWRLFDFRFTGHPPLWTLGPFRRHLSQLFHRPLGLDGRWLLLAAAVVLFHRTVIYFKVWQVYRRMPLLLGFFLVALFIWFGENIGTGAGARPLSPPGEGLGHGLPAKLTRGSPDAGISTRFVAAARRATETAAQPAQAAQPGVTGAQNERFRRAAPI